MSASSWLFALLTAMPYCSPVAMTSSTSQPVNWVATWVSAMGWS